MISTDSYYEIGAGHMFCQDYARNGSFEQGGKHYHYAIVSDGCSSSKDSDVGARILSFQFPMAIYWLLDTGTNITPFNIESYLKSILVQSSFFSKSCLDATVAALLYCVEDDKLYSFVWGDGKVYYGYKSERAKEEDATGFLTDLSYGSNAPFYLSYLLDAERIKAYEKEFGARYADRRLYVLSPTNVTELSEGWEWGIKCHYEVYIEASKTLNFACVFSDGVDTFHKKGEPNTTMARHILYSELVGYKNLNGEFVKRRMQAFKRQNEKDGWQHFDDCAVAAIAF